MLTQHHGHRQLRVLTLHVEHSTSLTYAWSQGALGHVTLVVITPVVITTVLMAPVLMTTVLMTTVLLRPYEQRAAQEYIPVLVLVLLLFWPPPPLHFL